MILIVDDDSDLAETCSMLLESHGYDVSVALNGKEALSQIKTRQPDLLISDCCMPDLTGVELGEQLNARPGGSPFPILLMSGSEQCRVAPTKGRHAKERGYDAFIKKPFLAENLLIAVRELLDGTVLSRRANAPGCL